MKLGKRILIVGIGSPHGDDQVGWKVVGDLSALANKKNIELRVAKSPADLFDWLGGSEHAIEHAIEHLVICDASHGVGRIGEIRNWGWPSPEFSEIAMSGTHNLSLPTVLALAQQLRRLPMKISIWTIEGATAKSNNSISPEVAQAIPKLVNRIVREMSQLQPGQELPCTNSP